MSWKPEVIADGSGKWVGNALRFATKEEAERNVRDLELRWFSVRETRVVECEDPVLHAYVDGRTVGAPGAYPYGEAKVGSVGEAEGITE